MLFSNLVPASAFSPTAQGLLQIKNTKFKVVITVSCLFFTFRLFTHHTVCTHVINVLLALVTNILCISLILKAIPKRNRMR